MNTTQAGEEQKTETELGVFEKNAGTKLIVRLCEWKGRKYIDLREWFTDKKDANNMIPTKKGITIPTEKFSDFINMMEKAEAAI